MKHALPWFGAALAAALLVTAARMAPLTDGGPDAASLGPSKTETAPTPDLLRLFTPYLETGRLTPGDAASLAQLPLDQALKALAGILGPAEDCPQLPFHHDCMELPDLNPPAVPDSINATLYHIEILELDEAAKSFRAQTSVRFTSLKTLNAVDLNLAKVTVTGVSILQGVGTPVPAAYTYRDSVLHIVLDPPLARGGALTVRVAYQGTNAGCTDSRGLRAGIVFTDQGVHAFSEPTYARYWYPCHDAIYDKADFIVTVTVPPGRKASASGVLVDSVQVNGQDVMTWTSTKAIAPYLVSFYINDYVTLKDASPDGVPLEYFVYPQLVEKAKADFVNVPDMVDYFSSIFGPYPSPRYAMSLDAFGGGMEHDANSLIESNFIRGNRSYESVFAHELAHQWWGDLVTPDYWNDVWLKEGVATYCELLYAEHRYGFAERTKTVALIDTVYKAALANPDSPIKDHPVAEPSPCKIFSWVVYQKGARVLDMVRGQTRLKYIGTSSPIPSTEFEARAQTGDRLFFDGLRRVMNVKAGGFINTHDFRALMLNGPNEDFYNDWLYGLGYPRYDLDWTRVRVNGAVGLRVRVTQEVPPGATHLFSPLFVHIRYRSGSRTLDESRSVGAGLNEWTVQLPPGTWTVEFDPDDWILETHRRVPHFTRFTPRYPYPNPSSSGFTLTGELEAAFNTPASVAVYDLQGRRVWEDDLGPQNSGTVQAVWNAVRSDGRRVPAGVYFARLHVGSQHFLQRLVVLP